MPAVRQLAAGRPAAGVGMAALPTTMRHAPTAFRTCYTASSLQRSLYALPSAPRRRLVAPFVAQTTTPAVENGTASVPNQLDTSLSDTPGATAGPCSFAELTDLSPSALQNLSSVRQTLWTVDPGLNQSLISSGTTVSQLFNQVRRPVSHSSSTIDACCQSVSMQSVIHAC